jgi:hypothetical protein
MRDKGKREIKKIRKFFQGQDRHTFAEAKPLYYKIF